MPPCKPTSHLLPPVIGLVSLPYSHFYVGTGQELSECIKTHIPASPPEPNAHEVHNEQPIGCLYQQKINSEYQGSSAILGFSNTCISVYVGVVKEIIIKEVQS